MALAFVALDADGDNLRHLAETRLAEYALNSVLVTALAVTGALLLGLPGAWLVTHYAFPGRTLLAWTLPLPLAMPSYVAAYAWLSMTGPGTALGAFVPMVSGILGAGFVFAVTFYPYVYLLARQAFEAQGMRPVEVARSLGAGPLAAFRRAALPIARPALVAGSALAAMEVLADYGVADILGAPTFTVGIVRAWTAFGDPGAAARLALILLGAALLALAVERRSRSARRFSAIGRREEAPRRAALCGIAAAGALLACLAPLVLGLFAPAFHLAWLAAGTTHLRPLLPAIEGTAMLATVSALLATVIGIGAAYGARAGGALGRAAAGAAQAGYAVPGAVAAVGILGLFAALQQGFDMALGPAAPAVAGGGILALLFAYQARFAAAAIGPCDAALQRIAPELDAAARSLGAGPGRLFARVHLPLAKGGIATAALLIFVEVTKELPATMILRPFDLDTLAVTAHNLASDERLAQAALPSLVLLALGLPAMAAASWLVTRSERPVR